jgi:hypothetical protein
MVVLKEPFLGWLNNYEGRLKSSWTGGSVPLLCTGRHNSIRAAYCRRSTNFSNGPPIIIVIIIIIIIIIESLSLSLDYICYDKRKAELLSAGAICLCEFNNT